MIHWGILGAGNIAGRFAQSLQEEKDSRLYAIALRSLQKGQAFMAKYPADRCYLDYDALLADSKVDAIYLALPHGLHAKWAIQALKQGKAVLCEKPAVVSEAQMRAIADTALREQCLFMEAMKTRFVPLYAKVKGLLKAGAIGTITAIDVSLCNVESFSCRGETYHMQPKQGGALLDVGIYCISWIEDLLQGEIYVRKARAKYQGAVDVYTQAELVCGDVAVHMECAFDRKKPRNLVIHGTKGMMIIEDHHRAQTLRIIGVKQQEIHMPYVVDDFYGEITHFVSLLKEGRTQSPLMPLAASIRCSALVDQIKAACLKEKE